MRRVALLIAAVTVACGAGAALAGPGETDDGGSVTGHAALPELEHRPPPPPPPPPEVEWRRSQALGGPNSGALVRGVQLPVFGRHFVTWDPVRERRPNRGWRRWGTDRLVRVLLRVARDHRRAHPQAPPLVIGDLSRRRGGDFGLRFGFPGHVSHQNGLDADVYFPRLDRSPEPPFYVEDIDRALAQDLVDRFVRAGALRVFVGPATGLTGPPGVVQELRNHDDHLHVRLRR
jgi:murein endopeptidase